MHTPRAAHVAIPRGLDTVTIAFAALFAFGCATSDPSPAPTTSQIALERIGAIGCGACNDARQITPVALAILDDERVAMLNPYEPLVRVFDLEGDPLLAFGAEGQGPGEIGQELPGAGYLPGMWLFGNELGGVTVIDVFPTSLEAFDAGGAFVERTDMGLADAVPTAQAFDPQTRTYYRVSFSFSPNQDDSRAISRCRFGDIGEARCDPFADPTPFLQPEGSPGATIGSLVIGAPPGGGLVVANSRTYGLWVLDQQGAIVASGGRELPPPSKTEAELEDERQRWARFGREDTEIDPHRPHIQGYGVQVDGAGRIWVLTGRYGENSAVFDVFAPDGSHLTEIAIDAVVHQTEMRITPFTARGDLLAVAAQQPDGNDQVWVYRISPMTPE